MKSIIFIALFFVFSSFAFAGECPPGSACFLCGGVDGIPCSTDCVGAYSEASDSYLSCSCPQGEPCECFCPFIAEMSEECALDFSCSSQLIGEFSGAIGYVAKIEGNPKLIKAGSGDEVALTPLIVINDGDTLVVGDGEHVAVMFPGNNLRTFWDESFITIDSQDETLRLDGEGEFWLSDTLPGKIVRELKDSKSLPRAVTITGTGDYIKYGESHSEIEYFDQHPEELYVEYGIHSEVFFKIAGGSQTVKVAEGRVTVRNNQGENAEVFTGEQYTSVAKKPGVKEDYDAGDEDLWWLVEEGEIEDDEASGGCCSPAFGLILSSIVFIFSKNQL